MIETNGICVQKSISLLYGREKLGVQRSVKGDRKGGGGIHIKKIERLKKIEIWNKEIVGTAKFQPATVL